MDNDIVLLSQQMRSAATLQELAALNDTTSKYGLVLTEHEMKELVEHRFDTLNALRRVEFGRGILPDLVAAFASSPYVMQETYAETIAGLQSVFYRLKEETDEAISDDDLIDSMRVLFDSKAHGSVEYFDSIDPHVLVAQAKSVNNDAHENWSEFDSQKEKKIHTSKNKEETHGASEKEAHAEEVDRVREGGEHKRPDNEYASNFYDGYNELYRKGFDFNSRIGGSSL